MSAAMEEAQNGSLGLHSVGRNIFHSQHLCLSPFNKQMKLPQSDSNVSNEDELPSPTLQDQDLPSPPVKNGHLTDANMQAYKLARDFIIYKTQEDPPDPTDDVARTLRRVGDEAVERHRTVVNAIAKRLEYAKFDSSESRSLNERMFLMIAPEIYHDGQENWGRIVMLYVLGSILAQNDIKRYGGTDFENIVHFVGKYVGTQKRKWIETHGGWGAFVKFFDNGAPDEKKVWKGLLAAVGIGALATSFTLAR